MGHYFLDPDPNVEDGVSERFAVEPDSVFILWPNISRESQIESGILAERTR
jgi:hypothetical protein